VRRLKKSTKLTSKSKALEMAHTLQKAAREARQHRLTEARARELLGELLEGLNGESLPVYTLEQWLEHFVKQKQKSRADKTALRYEQVKKDFVEFLGSRARLNIAAITSKDIADFRDLREGQRLAPSTLNGDIAILSAVFNAALRQGHITVNPCLAIAPVKDKATSRKATFTPAQVTALIGAADSEDWKGLISVAYYCGQRLGVVCRGVWTRAGRRAVETGEYKFFSPSFAIDRRYGPPYRFQCVIGTDAHMGGLCRAAAFGEALRLVVTDSP
jgi:integrase